MGAAHLPEPQKRDLRHDWEGLDDELIVGVASPRGAGTVRRAQRLRRLLNFYHRAA